MHPFHGANAYTHTHMDGHISGVQKIINDIYRIALFFHCTDHILNLVFNDLNEVNEVRNTAETIFLDRAHYAKKNT